MKFKVGDRVYDRWWIWKWGIVKAVLKTRIKIDFDGDLVVYDKPHMKFLVIQK